MGEKTKEGLKVQFDKRLRLEFHGARITSDAGLLACRELDGALELTEVAPTYLRDTRGGRNVQHEIVPLLRQSEYSRLPGYEDTNDALRLARDPAMQAVVGCRALEKQAASTNTLSRFETEVFVTEENQRWLEQMNEEWLDRAMMQTRHQKIILDMDSSESPVYGEQEGAAYNGHFQSVCYHSRSSCSTTSGTAREPCCGRETSIVLRPLAGSPCASGGTLPAQGGASFLPWRRRLCQTRGVRVSGAPGH